MVFLITSKALNHFLITIGVLIIGSTVACEGKKKSMTTFSEDIGSVAFEIVAPTPQPYASVAKIALKNGHLRITAEENIVIDTLIPIQDGKIKTKCHLRTGKKWVEFFIEDEAGRSLWKAEKEVEVRKDQETKVRLELQRFGDAAPQIKEIQVRPSAEVTVGTLVSFNVKTEDDHDATDSLQTRWDMGNDGRFEKEWSYEKDYEYHCIGVGKFTVKLEIKDLSKIVKDTTFQLKCRDTAPKIAFIQGNRVKELPITDFPQIFTVNPDGGKELKPLTDNREYSYSDISWSPDGLQIAFVASGNIFVMNTDGTGIVQLTDNREYSYSDISWSPDGLQIAFTSGDLFVMNADGTKNPTQLTRIAEPFVHIEHPSWSPNGSQIIFSFHTLSASRIFVMNANGTNEVQLTGEPYEGSVGPCDDASEGPSWSPDGQRIAFFTQANRCDSTGSYIMNSSGIYIMNTDGTNVVQLHGHSSDREPSWSPDSRSIVFVSDRDGNPEIYTMKADGTNVIQLTFNSKEDFSPIWSLQ